MQVYLIATDSKFLLDAEILKITHKSTNCMTYVYEKNLEDILEEASYLSLFGETKYVLVKHANFFGKDKLSEKESKLLERYLEEPNLQTVLIFITYEPIDKRNKWVALISQKYAFIQLEAPKNYALTGEIKKMMASYKVSDGAIKYLIEASLNNYDLICNEIQKFSLLFKPHEEITLAQMKDIVPSNVNDNLFKFTDAVLGRKMSETFKIYQDLLSVKTDVLQLFNLLLREFRLLYYYQILARKNYSKTQILEQLHLRDWQLDKIIRNASFNHLDDLRSYMLLLAKMDYQIKAGKVDKNMAFTSFLLEYFT